MLPKTYVERSHVQITNCQIGQFHDKLCPTLTSQENPPHQRLQHRPRRCVNSFQTLKFSTTSHTINRVSKLPQCHQQPSSHPPSSLRTLQPSAQIVRRPLSKEQIGFMST